MVPYSRALALLVIGGCSTLECGPGTYETGGYCLPVEDGDDDDTEINASDTNSSDTEEVIPGAPTADAGDDQAIGSPGTKVILDGSGSSDPDGDALTFLWAFTSIPEGSESSVNNAEMEQALFFPDLLGTYTVELTVSDGTNTDTDTMEVVVGESGNRPPMADAGEDQNVDVGETVFLDATASSDPDDDELTYFWFLATPKGSSAVLDDDTSATPSFTADVAGTYACNLDVSDGTSIANAVSFVVAGGGGTDTEDTEDTENDPPEADAGADATVSAGDTVTLDASASSDPEGDTLSYRWKVTKVPSGSSVTSSSIDDRDAVTTSVATDEAGTYTFVVRVSDDEYEDTDSVTYEAE